MLSSAEKIRERFPKDRAVLWFLLFCIWILNLEEPAARFGIPVVTVFRNLLLVLALIIFIIRTIHGKHTVRDILSPRLILGAVFLISGIIGWAANGYQSLSVTAFALIEHIRFWVCIYLFTELFLMTDLRRHAFTVFMHTAVISAVIIICSALDMIFVIWPRQMYRYGTSSLQLFFSHPSNLAAHCVFLMGMLCVLFPYLRRYGDKRRHAGTAALILVFLLMCVTVMTLRVRMFGFCIFFTVLFVYMTVLRWRLNLPVTAAAGAAAVAVGWRRLYDFYFSPYAYSMARGQFAVNSLDIARKNFPFGSGFGTFGSRMAQLNYSPLYYQYRMMTTIGMNPLHPAYACDTFFPCILAESGWLGLAAYAGLMISLYVSILKQQDKTSAFHSFAAFSAIAMLAFELFDSTGALAFSETYSILISMVIGFSFAVFKTE